MLFPVAFQTPALVEMKWTGVVKAFTVYYDSACLPSQVMGKAYVARKFYEDGSTVTYVKSGGTGTVAGFVLRGTGEGWVDRDKDGAATRILTRLKFPYEEASGRPAWSSESRFERKAEETVLTGFLREGVYARDGLILDEPKSYSLDILEALAFGSLPSLGHGVTLPVGVAAYLDPRSKAGDPSISVVGKRVALRPVGERLLVLAGKPESFLVYETPGSFIGGYGMFSGDRAGHKLLFRRDGSLAAFFAMSDLFSYVSRFETVNVSGGSLQDAPSQASEDTQRFAGGIFVKTVVPSVPSESESQSVLGAIRPKYRSVPTQAPDLTTPPQTTPPR